MFKKRISERKARLETILWLSFAVGFLVLAVPTCSVLLYQKINESRVYREEIQRPDDNANNRICYLDKGYLERNSFLTSNHALDEIWNALFLT